jgi:cell division protein FtsL
MTEYYTLKRIDNSRLVRTTAPHRWRELGRKMLGGAALGFCLLTYAWQHFECIQLRYSLEQLQAAKRQATELNQQLGAEAASLSARMRIDAIAREQLGLTVPVPGQVAPALSAVEGVVAQVRPASVATRP